MADEREQSLTRRVALGALGVATAATVAGVAGVFDDPPAPAGGAASGSPINPRDGLRAQIEADLRRAAEAPANAPRTRRSDPDTPRADAPHIDAPATAPAARGGHPDDPTGRPDTLQRRAILRGGAARRVLYTWTTPDQIAALRAGGRLLHRRASARHGRSRFDLTLDQIDDHPLHAILRRKPFRRFAWPYPWATVSGWPGETYGDQLLRVEMKPCALACLEVETAERIVGTLDTEREVTHGVWRHAPKPLSAIGAIFHTAESRIVSRTSSFSSFGGSMREYVLFSEAHIAGFDYGTAACKAAIEADITFLRGLITTPPWPADPRFRVFGNWPESVRDTQDAYVANLAFYSVPRVHDVGVLEQTVQILQRALRAQGGPLIRSL